MLATTLIIPAFLVFTKDLLTAVATDSTSSLIFQIVDFFTKQSHEQQLKDCIKKAFKQTKKQQHWKIKTRKALKDFQLSLVSFSGAFSQKSLSEILSNAIGKEAGDDEVEQWIDNLLRQLSLDEHKELRNYLLLKRILVDSSDSNTANEPEQARLDYLLTYTTPVWDNKDVICRDKTIKELFAKFSKGTRRIQVAGMGGLGKSEILVKFFYQLNQPNAPVQFDYIGFIRFNDDLESDFRSQIPYLADYARKNGEEAAKLFLQQLCATNRILFCVDDNRDKKEIFKNNDPSFVFLKTLNASILFASRTEYADFEQQPFPPLSTEDCIKIFQRMYEQEVHSQKGLDNLTKIIEELSGNNTLIVNRLGNMAKENNFTIDKLYKNLLDKNFHIKTGCVDEEELQQQISKLYPLSELTRPGERNIVEAFSIFPVNPLPIDLCVEWLYEDAGINEEDCSLTLTRLSKQTWLDKRINITNKEVLFSMHPCVKSAIRDQVSVEYSDHQNIVKRCANWLNVSTEKFYLQVSSSTIPFAVSIYTEVFQESLPFVELSAAIACSYQKTATYSHAQEWFQKALVLSKKVVGEHPTTATIYNNIASIYDCQGQYKLALEWYERALVIRETMLGKDHPDSAITYNNIACVYYGQGQYDIAQEWYKKALLSKKSIQGKDHPDTATTYNNIAGVFKEQGEYNLALEWYQKALVISENTLGIDNPDTAITYNNIAGIYYSQHQNNLALEWYQKALNINEKALGREHPETATNYNNIASVFKNQKKLDLALEWYQKALAISEKLLGKNHPFTANTSNNIGGIYSEQGHYNLALEWYRNALEIRERVLDKDHPDTATSYNNIATVYYHQKKFNLALMWFQKALFIFEKVLGNEHPDTANTVNNIANVYCDLGKKALALDYFKRALLVFQTKLGPEDPTTINTKMTISNLEDSTW